METKTERDSFIALEDISLKENGFADYPYFHGHINMPIRLLGQLRFEGCTERFGLAVEKSVNLEDCIEQINDYLLWLADCRGLLEIQYIKESQDWIDQGCGVKLPENWYEHLEMYAASIEVEANGDIGASFSCGGRYFDDQLLMIDFSGKVISAMWLDS